jgi:hypothetical protein
VGGNPFAQMSVIPSHLGLSALLANLIFFVYYTLHFRYRNLKQSNKNNHTSLVLHDINSGYVQTLHEIASKHPRILPKKLRLLHTAQRSFILRVFVRISAHF